MESSQKSSRLLRICSSTGISFIRYDAENAEAEAETGNADADAGHKRGAEDIESCHIFVYTNRIYVRAKKIPRQECKIPHAMNKTWHYV